MYKHREDLTNIIAHDCIAEAVFMDQGDLVMEFPEGLWISLHHPENNSGRVLHTDAACIRFEGVRDNADDLPQSFCLHVLQKEKRDGTRSARSICGCTDIVDYLMVSRARLEVLDVFDKSRFYLLRGVVRYPRNRHGEFFLEIMADGVSCLWNDISPDWVW